MHTFFLAVVLGVTLSQVSASCKKHCQCPPDKPRCAAGIHPGLDSCGCCEVCAQQLFEDCSKTKPCDHTKGLECNFGGGTGSARGVCRAKSDGRTCEYNNKIYQNGETFQPNCKHQCTCMDGAVGCVSLCPHELALPKLGCDKPRMVKVPGLCCEQLICPEDAQTKKKFRPSKKDFMNSNELFHGGETKSLPAFRSHSKGLVLARRGECVSHTTTWSPCSRSCGTGVSTRLTNRNTQCEMMKESRVCEIRPCSQLTDGRLKKAQKCTPTEKASRPVNLSYAGCDSLRMFQPRYCGSCSDGRCCRPHRTQTLPVRFRCRNGDTFSKMVMMIQSCKCGSNCSGSRHKPPAHLRFSNDVLTARM